MMQLLLYQINWPAILDLESVGTGPSSYPILLPFHSNFLCFSSGSSCSNVKQRYPPDKSLSMGMGETNKNCTIHWIEIYLAPVVQNVDNAIHQTNIQPLNSATDFPNTYLLDSDLSSGQRYPTFEQLEPDGQHYPALEQPRKVCSKFQKE